MYQCMLNENNERESFGSIPDCRKVKNLINIKNISEIKVLYAFGSECENWYIKSYQKMKTLDSLQT